MWSQTATMSPWIPFWPDLKKKVLRYLLNRYLGQFLQEKLSLDQLNVDLYKGTGTVYNVTLQAQVCWTHKIKLPYSIEKSKKKKNRVKSVWSMIVVVVYYAKWIISRCPLPTVNFIELFWYAKSELPFWSPIFFVLRITNNTRRRVRHFANYNLRTYDDTIYIHKHFDDSQLL